MLSTQEGVLADPELAVCLRYRGFYVLLAVDCKNSFMKNNKLFLVYVNLS